MNDLSDYSIISQQLRAEITFKKTRDLLAEKGIVILLLKGPHLGSTVYESPKDRLYADLDILVKPANFEAAASLLRENGFKPFAFDKFDPEVQRDFKHWEFNSPWGIMVELHRWLSGHDRYRIDNEGLFQRAEPFAFGETHALGLGQEDLLLHLCLHMGSSYFHVIERKHVIDIALLINKKSLDWPIFLRRVKNAGASAIAYYALRAALLQENAPVPAAVMEGLRLGRLRRAWLERNIEPGSFPIYRFPEHSLKRIKRRMLLVLLDRPGQWLSLVSRIAVTKLRWMIRVAKGN